MSSRLLIETRIVVIMSSSFAVRLEKKKNRKIIFVVFFFSMMLFSIEKKKNQRAISVDFFLDRASSSSSLTFSLVESSSANSSFSSSLSSITLKKLAIMSETLLNDISNSIEIRCDENFFKSISRFRLFVCVVVSFHFFRIILVHSVDFLVVSQSVAFAEESSLSVFDIAQEESQVCESLWMHLVDQMTWRS